jgi:methyl-galactoside transport system substrate-binding protein
MNIVGRRAAVTVAFSLSLFFSVCLWGCESKPPEKAAPSKTTIGVLVYKHDDTYIELVSSAIEETLVGKAEVEIVAAEGDQLMQNEQIDAFIKKNVSALAVNIVDTQAAARAVDAIKKAGIPVVFFNREPDLNSIKAYDRARFVGTTASDAGVLQGEIIAELWRKHPEFDRNKDGKCQYVMIQANLDNPEAVARTEFSVKQARKEGVDMQQVGETLFCSWDENMAYEAMRLMFPYNGNKMELIIANNDSMALGAIRALNEFGYNLGGGSSIFIPVVGVDAIPRAVEAIQKDKMSGTVVQDSAAMGRTVAAMLLNAVGGRDFLDGVPYNWDDSGIAIRIP